MKTKAREVVYGRMYIYEFMGMYFCLFETVYKHVILVFISIKEFFVDSKIIAWIHKAKRLN